MLNGEAPRPAEGLLRHSPFPVASRAGQTEAVLTGTPPEGQGQPEGWSAQPPLMSGPPHSTCASDAGLAIPSWATRGSSDLGQPCAELGGHCAGLLGLFSTAVSGSTWAGMSLGQFLLVDGVPEHSLGQTPVQVGVERGW